MPRGNPRGHFSIRIADDAMAQVDKIAEEEGRTRTDMIRRLLSEALAARTRKSR